MSRTKLFAVAVARTSLIAMTAFTLVVAVRVLGTEVPQGHPPVESCPPYPLPPGHPPIGGTRQVLPVFRQDGTSTI